MIKKGKQLFLYCSHVCWFFYCHNIPSTHAAFAYFWFLIKYYFNKYVITESNNSGIYNDVNNTNNSNLVTEKISETQT